MSAPGPESIPTSADPRSRRPTKKRALTPVSAQAATVDALFAKPDQHIRMPDPEAAAARSAAGRAPPEIVANVQGSSAGAGSGEFHVYKASRRREYERLRQMDVALRREADADQFDKDKTERDRRDEERTRKNREKREKMKARKANKAKGPQASGAKNATATTASGDSSRPGQAASTAKDRGDDQSTTTSEPAGLVIHDDD